jgi:ABC-type oligopeptide transport system ATPase subunit
LSVFSLESNASTMINQMRQKTKGHYLFIPHQSNVVQQVSRKGGDRSCVPFISNARIITPRNYPAIWKVLWKKIPQPHSISLIRRFPRSESMCRKPRHRNNVMQKSLAYNLHIHFSWGVACLWGTYSYLAGAASLG